MTDGTMYDVADTEPVAVRLRAWLEEAKALRQEPGQTSAGMARARCLVEKAQEIAKEIGVKL